MSKKKSSGHTPEAAKEETALPPLPHMQTTAAIFGKRLSALLKQRGWSQSDLAAAIWQRKRDSRGFLVANKRDLISAYVKGEMLPSRENAQKIATAFGMTFEELMPSTARLEPPQEEGIATRQTVRDNPRMTVWNARYVISKELADFFEEIYARFEEARKRGEPLKLPRL